MKAIIFLGIVEHNNVPHLLFSCKETEATVEVPIDRLTADRISKYLSRITPPAPQAERLNDEPTD